jgi:enoyl-CoA hydratase
MEFKNIEYKKEDNKAYILINKPKSLNSLNKETLLELEQAIDLIAKDKKLQVVIIRGKGDKAFVAGADIKEMAGMDPIQAEEFASLGQRVFDKIEKLSIPVIAAVNGHALGGGCELALACDIRIASENAQFGQPEVGLGIIPGFGGTQRLNKIIGEGLAKEYIYTGKFINSKKAKEINLVNHVVKLEKLDDKAEEIANQIMNNSPFAVKMAKEAINFKHDSNQSSGLDYEAKLFGLCFSTYDQQEGMQAFIKREKPHFKGE